MTGDTRISNPPPAPNNHVVAPPDQMIAAPPADATAGTCQVAVPCPAAAPSPFDGDCCVRPLMLGSLCGVRDQLAAHGITFNADTYQIYQGVATGGIHNVFEYSGHNDYFINVDGEKAGLWKGLFISLHGETRYGDSVSSDTGAILPVNTAALFPTASGSETALTGVKFTQALSENFVTFAGKINLLDAFPMPITGARDLDGFLEPRHGVPGRRGQNGPLLDSGSRSCRPAKRGTGIYRNGRRYKQHADHQRVQHTFR